jgi:hypothetical protein
VLKLKDNFDSDIVPGRLYGIGNIRSRLEAYEFIDCPQSGDLLFRKHRSGGQWLPVYAQDTLLPRFCVLLNDDLSEVVNYDDDHEDSIEKLVDWAESRVLTLRAELQAVEDKLCDQCGVSKGDDSDVSNAIFDLVWNSGPARIVLESMPAKAA